VADVVRYTIPLTRPWIDQAVKKRVEAVLDSGYLTEGPVTRAFEEAIRSYLGAERVIAVSSATVGLEVALRALQVGPGDEVIVPDFTYPASAHAVSLAGATPVLVDVHPRRMTLDLDLAEQAITSRTRAIMPVSAFGNPIDYDHLNRLKQRYGLLILEDAAPALGARFKDVPVGVLADISVFSLHPRKFVTTGEGGLIVTADHDRADWMTSYKHFGMVVPGGSSEPVFERLGTNCKISDILAAVGLAQMENVDELLARRVELSEIYDGLLAAVEGVMPCEVTANGFHSRQSYVVFVEHRDDVMMRLRSRGIEVQIGTYALHRQPAFKGRAGVRSHGGLAGSDWAFEHSLALPLYHDLAYSEQTTVVRELESAVRACAASPAR
jgi:dTDP-4-amino-4,6-dideoxygalactose transaminase